jgi:hypothetical protein
MSRENLAAFTPAVDLPPYVSINWEGTAIGNTVEITVRSVAKSVDEQGDTATIKMGEKEFAQLWSDVKSHFQAIQIIESEGG